MLQDHAAAVAAREATILTGAALKAADRLNLSGSTLAAVLGLSPASLTRMRRGQFLLERNATGKAFELAVLFVRLYRSLDAIVGGDMAVAQDWLRNQNTALNGKPIDKIKSIPGLVETIAYLDARRAPV
mgnify:CR=1 FL=1